MQKLREKLLYVFLVHFSALMLVFLFTGAIQLLLGNYIMLQLDNPVINAMIQIMKANLNYPVSKLLIGMITFIFFIPMDLAILYSVSREVFEKEDIMSGIEEGIKRWPLFLVFISDMYFFSFTYLFFSPVVVYILFRVLEPKTDWRIHVLSTILISSWFVPLSLVGRIENVVTRNIASFLLYLCLAFPFFIHAWLRKEGIK